MNIKEFITNGVAKIGIKKVKRKSSVLRDFMDDPENFKLEAFIDGEEIVVKIKKKEESQN